MTLMLLALALYGCPDDEDLPDPPPPVSWHDLRAFPSPEAADGWLAWSKHHQWWTAALWRVNSDHWAANDEAGSAQWWSDYLWEQQEAAAAWALLRAAQVEHQPEWARRETLRQLHGRLGEGAYRAGLMPPVYRLEVMREVGPDTPRRGRHAEGALGLGWLWL